MDTIKNLFATTSSMLLAYFAPIQDIVFVIFFVFLINCIAGLISGILKNDERFNVKKFFRCLVETLIFYFLVLSVYVVGEKMGNISGAIQCITGVVYSIIYFYSVNILRNVSTCIPESKSIAFIYYVVSFEIVKKIPYLSDFLNKKKNDNRPE